MKSLNFNCEGQSLSLIKSDNSPYTDSKNYIKINIHFDDDYTELQKVLVFSYVDENNKNVIIKQIYDDNDVNKLPVEVSECSRFYLSLYTLGDTRITTNECLVEFEYSGYLSLYEETGLTHFKNIANQNMIYDATYESLNYTYAYNYFDNNRYPPKNEVPKKIVKSGGCSAFFKDNFLCRNFDWYYSYACSSIIRTENTIGIVGGINDFSYDFINKRKYTDLYTLLPFLIRDGMNDEGLCCASLTIANRFEDERPLDLCCTVPTETTKDKVSCKMLVRYILDKFNTVEQTIEYLQKYVEIYFPYDIINNGENLQWLLSDKTGDSCVLNVNPVPEWQKGGLSDTEVPLNIVSNFCVKDVIYNEEDNTVYTPYDTSKSEDEGGDINPCKDNNIQEYGMGLERHNIMAESVESLSSLNDCRELLEELRFTQAYEDLPEEETRFTDYVGYYGKSRIYSCCQPMEAFVDIQSILKDFYRIRKRDERDELWETQNTNYSVIYDLDTFSLYVASQENFDDWEKIKMK